MDAELWYAYAAGFIDAEGSFCITRVNMAKWGFQDNHRLQIDVGQHVGRIAVLHDLQRAFGGQVSIKKQNSKSYDPTAHIATWHLQNRADVERFVRAIYPHLRCKRLQAEIALEFLAATRARRPVIRSGGVSGRRYWSGTQRLTDAQMETREQLRLRMRAANHLSKYPPLPGAAVEPVSEPDSDEPVYGQRTLFDSDS